MQLKLSVSCPMCQHMALEAQCAVSIVRKDDNFGPHVLFTDNNGVAIRISTTAVMEAALQIIKAKSE